MNPLLKLLAQNKGKSQPVRSEVNGDEATIYVYGVIVNDDWFGGVMAETFVRELHALTAETIHIRIQSPGGDVFAAVSMVQAMLEHKSKLVVHIDGMAASAATFLVMAADESIIVEGGEFMIHKAWTFAAGNEFDFLKVAEELSKVDATIVDKYMTKVEEARSVVEAWMADETSFYGQEAVDAGFVGSVFEPEEKATVENWNLSAYKDDVTPPKKPDPIITPEPEPEKPDLSAHYRQLQVVELTA